MATVATIADTTIVGDNEDQLVTMIVDDQLFGIPILQVQDIVEASEITPVPLAPSAIAGVLNLRGRIVTVVDLRKLLDNHEEVPWESQMGVTVEHKGDLYTLLVDAIGDVRTLPRRDFDKAPSTMEDNIRQLCSGIYRLRGNLLVVLDVARILHTDVIEATPMLTVEERRSRKTTATSKTDQGEARTHQLSALMTDLNAYESETDGAFFAGSETDDDDAKARKRASRDRRSVAERWREVLEEKARKSGQVAYRMREPDEETVETARDAMAEEDAEWAARVIDENRALPGGSDDAAELEALIGDAVPDLPLPAAADNDDDKTAGTAAAGPDGAPDMPVEQGDTGSRDPFMLDAVPDLPAETPEIEDRKPQEPDLVADLPTEAPEIEDRKPQEPDLVADLPMEAPEIEAQEPEEPDPVAELPVEAPKITAGDLPQPDPLADSPVDEVPTIVEPEPQEPDPVVEPPVEAPKAEAASPESPAKDMDAPDTPGRDIGGIASGWWNKLRGKSGESTPESDVPSSSDEDSGPESAEAAAAEDSPRAAAPDKSPRKAKPAKKKTAAKPKAKAKSGTKSKSSSKSGSKPKAQAKPKPKAKK
jgi:purine-binding chemotaxis protein CheW